MYKQISLFDSQNNIEDVVKDKPWARVCYDDKCWDYNQTCNHICTSYYQCEKRKEYKTVNKYTVEKLNGRRTLISPVGGITILCEGNQKETDDLIQKTIDYFGFDVSVPWSEK